MRTSTPPGTVVNAAMDNAVSTKVVRPRLRLRALHLDPTALATRDRNQELNCDFGASGAELLRRAG